MNQVVLSSSVFDLCQSAVPPIHWRKNVGLQGFEPWTSCTRGRRSTKLSHSPNFFATQPPASGPAAAQPPYFAQFDHAGK
jgi:hypothetical protein